MHHLGIVELRTCWQCAVRTREHGKCASCGAPRHRPWVRALILAAVVVAIAAYGVIAIIGR